MKTKIYSLIMGVALAGAGLTSCHEDAPLPVAPVEKGTVNLKSMGIDVNNAERIIEHSSRASIDLSAYKIQIFREDGSKHQEWVYNAMPEVFELPVGKYRAYVYSHEVQKAEWDRPYFVGEKEFEINNDAVTDLGMVTCKLANIKVTIKHTSDLRKLMGDDVKVTVIANDQGRLDFTPEETRSGYFEALEGSSTLIVEFNGTVNGNFETKRLVITDAEAGQHRIVTFKIPDVPGPKPTDPTGGMNPGIGIDAEVTGEDMNVNVPNDEELLNPDDRPGGEDPEDPEDPENPDTPDDPVTPDPADQINITSATLSFTESNDPLAAEAAGAVVNVSAPKGIEHFMVKIESDNNNFIAAVGGLLPLSFDLAYPGDREEDFKSMDFPVGSEVIGSTSLDFDITQFVGLLAGFPGNHRFTLSVQDSAKQQEVKSLLFVAK